jgi:hypothetical protein
MGHSCSAYVCALTLAARELVRIAAGELATEPDLVEELGDATGHLRHAAPAEKIALALRQRSR